MKKIAVIALFLLRLAFGPGLARAQYYVEADSSVTTYLHIKAPGPATYRKDSVVGFVLKNIDSSGKVNWTSWPIKDFEKDKDGFFIKADIPRYVSRKPGQIWCERISVQPRKGGNGTDTVRMKYGGVRLSKIKLFLKSSPEGAETYLIPNRIWMKQFDKTEWQKAGDRLEKYRVNTSSTNTYAFIDETVFVVLYKINDRFKKLIHHTRPATVEQEQTVWIKF